MPGKAQSKQAAKPEQNSDEFSDFDFDSAYGAEAAEKAQERYAGSGDFVKYVSMEDKETIVFRFISDAFRPPKGDPLHDTFPYNVPWITVDVHAVVPTKPAPKGYTGNWPKSMSAVCRKDKVFKSRYGGVCWIHDNVTKFDSKSKTNKPHSASPRTFALVAMREMVYGTREMADGGQITDDMVGKLLGIRDKMREIKKTNDKGEETGEVERVKDIRILNYGWKNCYSALQTLAGRFGTMLDRDFTLTRKGTDQATIYVPDHLEPIDVKDPDDPEKVIRFDLRDPRLMARYDPIPDLRKLVAEQASDEYYKRFFIPGADDGEADQKSGPAAPSTEVEDNDRLKALKERVSGYTPDGEGAQASPNGSDGEAAKDSEETSTQPAFSSGGMMDFSS